MSRGYFNLIQLFSAIYTSTSIPYCTSSSEMETLLSTIIRALENSNNQVRQDVADTISTILELSQQKTIKNEKSNEVKPVLTVEEMFTILNTLFIKSYTREVKIGIFECHASLLKKLSIKFLEKNYVSIANIFINFAALPKLVVNWNDTLMIRDSCGFLLRIIGKTLGEVGQVSALQELNNILLKWTGVDSTNSKYSYTLILIEAAALLIDIGSAASSIQDSLCDSFLALMNHPSESVNIALAWALRCLCFSLPYLLPKLLSKLLPIMEKDASILSSDKPEIFKKFSSYSLVVASLITVIPHKPFSVSFEYIAKVFGLASSLIKASTGTIKDLKVSQAQSQTGWILVSSIMTLGPNFVREHLSQLLMFWKTVFTKNTSSKDKSEAEVLCWVTTRDSALSALYNFLHYNSKSLVTNDVTKRIIVCLNNCSTYDSPILYVTVPPSKNTIMFAEKELSMKRRLFACYSNLNTKLFDSSHHLLLRLAIETFAPEPDKVSDRGALISLIDKSSAQVFDYYSSNSLNDISRNNVSDGIGIRFFKDSQVKIFEDVVYQLLI